MKWQNTRLKFSDIPLDEFWIAVGKECKQISEKALEILLQFCTTYLCEQSFSMLVLIKNDKRSCLKEIDRELRVAISNMEPNIQWLSLLRQPQASHWTADNVGVVTVIWCVNFLRIFAEVCCENLDMVLVYRKKRLRSTALEQKIWS